MATQSEATTATDAPLAAYHERIPLLVDRRFSLYADRLRVVGKARSVRFDSEVPLKGLVPRPNRLWIRSKHYEWASLLLGGMVALLAVAIVVGIRQPALMVMLVILVGPALWYWVAAFRRIEYAQFRTAAGAIVLDVARAGPTAEGFDAFVQALETRCVACDQG